MSDHWHHCYDCDEYWELGAPMPFNMCMKRMMHTARSNAQLKSELCAKWHKIRKLRQAVTGPVRYCVARNARTLECVCGDAATARSRALLRRRSKELELDALETEFAKDLESASAVDLILDLAFPESVEGEPK